jgi:hypothetical protein
MREAPVSWARRRFMTGPDDVTKYVLFVNKCSFQSWPSSHTKFFDNEVKQPLLVLLVGSGLL